MSEDIQVGNLTKPVVRKPLPKKPAVEAAPVDAKPAAAPAPATSNDAGIAELNAKMEDVLKFLQAIDWKMWVYLKANNYID
jgi:3-oxoacyl-ACP reductase-like protein